MNRFWCASHVSMALTLSLASGPILASTGGKASSAEDKARFVSITRNLDEAPFAPNAKADRAWAVDWLAEAPDVSVAACLDPLGHVDNDKYAYGAEIVVQYMFEMGAFVIQHPETSQDMPKQQLAGVEGALKTYRSILRDRPDAQSPALDKLLEIRARGDLPAFVNQAWKKCQADK